MDDDDNARAQNNDEDDDDGNVSEEGQRVAKPFGIATRWPLWHSARVQDRIRISRGGETHQSYH